MEPIQKGKQTNKTSNMCTGDKGKQTNKQAEAACVEAQMQGAVQSCVTCGAQYAMCQSMQKSFGDASEMHQKSAEFDTQGCTLTRENRPYRLLKAEITSISTYSQPYIHKNPSYRTIPIQNSSYP